MNSNYFGESFIPGRVFRSVHTFFQIDPLHFGKTNPVVDYFY